MLNGNLHNADKVCLSRLETGNERTESGGRIVFFSVSFRCSLESGRQRTPATTEAATVTTAAAAALSVAQLLLL